MIVAAKSLNDSSPLNKHWTKYTDGLLTLEEVNLAERELLNILNWKTNITKEELIISLYPFLQPIIRQHEEYIQHQQYKIRMMQNLKPLVLQIRSNRNYPYILLVLQNHYIQTI